jgi:hypothetical protein
MIDRQFDLASLVPAIEQREPCLWFATQRQETIVE